MRRDPYLDALRAGSLAVVVLWHWLGTQLIWRPDGPHATSPLASVPGLWLGTWLLQVMPVFFYVGGCLHRRSYRPRYVPRRALGLLRATAPLLVGWAAVGGLLAVAGGGAWAAGTVTLAHSGLSAWATALHGRGLGVQRERPSTDRRVRRQDQRLSGGFRCLRRPEARRKPWSGPDTTAMIAVTSCRRRLGAS